MHDLHRHRPSGDFLPMDLGIRAAKAICDRFGAQVTDFAAEGRRTSITLKLPPRLELFNRSIQRARAVTEEAEKTRKRSADALATTEANRNANRALRASLAEIKRSLTATRLESRSIISGLAAGSTQHPPAR